MRSSYGPSVLAASVEDANFCHENFSRNNNNGLGIAIVDRSLSSNAHNYPQSLALRKSANPEQKQQRKTHQRSLSLDAIANLPPITVGNNNTTGRKRPDLRIRPLMLHNSKDGMHNIHIEPVPESPPELTNSKSSKSSSFKSSSFVDSLGPTDVSHFEDISLDDLHLNLEQNNYATTTDDGTLKGAGQRQTLRASTPTIGGARSSTQGFRDLTNSGKPSRPSLKGHVNGAVNQQPSLSLPRARSPRKRRSAQSPSFIPANPFAPHSRSTSPIPSFSPRSFSSRSLSPMRSPISPGMRALEQRRPSQPTRKTVQELEDEYNDEDEELPDDAVIWNVPLSPRPPQQRSPSDSVGNTEHAMQNGQEDTPQQPSPPPSLTPPSLVLSPAEIPGGFTSPSFPNDVDDSPDLSRTRTKSWTDAMIDLSPEARDLTQALEDHAEEVERQHEEKVQLGQHRPLSADGAKTSKASAIELPPLRKGEIMIDPLPISKEKEKVLARTRPSWLPPKDPKEEKRHLKEYQRMMAASQEAEKRKTAKKQEEQKVRDETQKSISRIWDQHVLPNWDHVINEPRTRELWWRGISPRSRGTVWQKAIGNELELSDTSYHAALNRAKALEGKMEKMNQDDRSKMREHAWFKAIRRDILTTFPELKIFQADGPLSEPLRDVLMAYSQYRSDVGYVYGTHLIAALLILNLSPPSAFTCLANILNRPLPMAFLVHDTGAMSRAYDLVLQTLDYKLPALHNHLLSLGIPVEEFLDPMFQTLFCTRLGVDCASRVWDIYVFEGDKALIRAAVGTLARLEGKLYSSREEVIGLLGWDENAGAWDLGEEDGFVNCVREAGKVGR